MTTQVLIPDNSTNQSTSQDFNARSSSDAVASSGSGLSRIAIGALVGATLGGLAAALANRETGSRITQTIRNFGGVAKNTASNVVEMAKQIEETVDAIAVSVNDTVEDLGEATGNITVNLGGTVQNTMSTVKGTAQGLNTTLKAATGAVRGATGTNGSSEEQTLMDPNTGKRYKLTPVD